MKNISITTMLLFSILVFNGCASKVQHSSEINRQWMMIGFQNFSKNVLVENQANLDLSLVKSPPNQYSAKMGCNQMFFRAEFKDNGDVKFSEVGSTLMYCEKSMDLETAFGKALPTMSRYKIQGHYLTLSDGKGNEMKFIAADWD